MSVYYTLVNSPKADRCEPLMASLLEILPNNEEISRDDVIAVIEENQTKIAEEIEDDEGNTKIIYEFNSGQEAGKILSILIKSLYFGEFVEIRKDKTVSAGSGKGEVDRMLEVQQTLLDALPDVKSNEPVREMLQEKIDVLKAKIVKRDANRAAKAAKAEAEAEESEDA